MRQLFHEVVGDGDRLVLFVHGILGRGRNWRTVARRLVARTPGWRAVLVDLRNHGDSPPLPPPHDLSACAADLERLLQVMGEPAAVVGHSFGGKVVLQWALHQHEREARAKAGRFTGRTVRAEVWVLDCPLSAVVHREGNHPDDPRTILAALREAPVPSPDRDALRAHLRGRGIAEPVVAWLLTSAREGTDGWRFVYDLDGVAAMMASFDATDFWPRIDAFSVPIHLVRGARSGVWSTDELERLAALPRGPVDLTILDAGHWLQVDAPDALLDVLRLPADG